MTPSAVFAVGAVLCAGLLIGSCAGRVIDLRWPGRAGRFGACFAFVVVLGVAIVETSGTAAFGELLSHSTPGGRQELAAFIAFVAAGIGAVAVMTLSQVLALISGLARRGGRLWLGASVVAAVVSLALMWSSVKTLQLLFGPVSRVEAILAPTVGAAVITALLLARAVAYQLARIGVAEIRSSSSGGESGNAAVEELVVSNEAVPAPAPGGLDDQARYRRPGIG